MSDLAISARCYACGAEVRVEVGGHHQPYLNLMAELGGEYHDQLTGRWEATVDGTGTLPEGWRAVEVEGVLRVICPQHTP